MERRLEATDTAAVHFKTSSGLLLENPSQFFTSAAGSEARRTRRFPVEVTVDLRGGSAAGQRAIVELGLPRESGEAVVVDLIWRPVRDSRLLPIFDGSLELTPDGSHTRLHLCGTYRPPLGLVGALFDRIAGHRLARPSVAALLRTVAQRLDDEAFRTAPGARIVVNPPDRRDV